MFCSCLSRNTATEQGLTQQLTRESKAETVLRAVGKGPVAASLAPLAGRLGLVPLSGLCATEQAQITPWGKASKHLYSEDVHRTNIGSC